MPASQCFPPIARADARVLILGSLPGEESLRRQEYYALKHNAFWKIIERLFGIAKDDPFEERKAQLIMHNIAVWDVCAAATRPGSLDSAIEKSSIIPNDFAGFFIAHPALELVCFNGRKAEEIYRRLVMPGLPVSTQRLRYASLPSTSPAHAGMNFEAKSLRWQEVIGELLPIR